jgi:integrase
MASSRARGTGSIFEKNGIYYGRWRTGKQRHCRSLGPVRQPHTKEGLTKAMAEDRLREKMNETAKTPAPVKERYDLTEVGKRHIADRRKAGKRENTLQDYESYLRVHLAPHFGSKPITKIEADDIEELVDELLERGYAPKSIRNYLGLLHGIFEFARRKRWATSNPCELVEGPQDSDADQEIHFLDQTEVEALIRAAPDDDLGEMEAVMYRAAAMSGLRQGELLALRWMDIDWLARKVRVRFSRSRGRLGPTKSKRSSRAVPLAFALAGELERHYQRTPFKADEDLVFAHPHTGGPYDRSRLLKRFKAALRRAAVREVRFHDLRHTFGTRMAAAGVPMRTLQEWMGHRDIKTTQIYADYAPSADEANLVDAAFAQVANEVAKLRKTQDNSNQETPAYDDNDR